MEAVAIRKPWKLEELFAISMKMWEVQPERYVSSSAISATSGESNAHTAHTFGNIYRPSKEHVGYYTKRRPAATFFVHDITD
jgi:hypothetical protein